MRGTWRGVADGPLVGIGVGSGAKFNDWTEALGVISPGVQAVKSVAKVTAAKNTNPRLDEMPRDGRACCFCPGDEEGVVGVCIDASPYVEK